MMSSQTQNRVMVRQERTAECDTETTTASEAELRGLIRRAAGAQQNQSFRVAVGILLIAAVLATGAVVAMMQPGFIQSTDNEVELEANNLWSTSPRRGCDNWETIALNKVRMTDVDSCGNDCKNTAGCKGFGFQPGQCGTDGLGDQPFTCYLWGGICKEGHNPCWDQHNMLIPKAPAWLLTANRRGCANWRDIQIGKTTTKSSEGSCGLACLATVGCTSFNFQPGPCTGPEMVGKGACMLFKGDCAQESNNCWDLYSMDSTYLASVGLLQDIPAGSTSIHVTDQSEFDIGDTIIITNGKYTWKCTVVAKGSLTINPPSEYSFSKDDTVVHLVEKSQSSTAAPSTSDSGTAIDSTTTVA